MSKAQVAQNYFFTYFFIDFLSTIPMFFTTCKADLIFYSAEILSLLKMFRIGTFLNYMKRLAEVSISFQTTKNSFFLIKIKTFIRF